VAAEEIRKLGVNRVAEHPKEYCNPPRGEGDAS